MLAHANAFQWRSAVEMRLTRENVSTTSQQLLLHSNTAAGVAPMLAYLQTLLLSAERRRSRCRVMCGMHRQRTRRQATLVSDALSAFLGASVEAYRDAAQTRSDVEHGEGHSRRTISASAPMVNKSRLVRLTAHDYYNELLHSKFVVARADLATFRFLAFSSAQVRLGCPLSGWMSGTK